jgi:S-DNA-T family DNA segregation ATPase FtsK/SpoIIIE
MEWIFGILFLIAIIPYATFAYVGRRAYRWFVLPPRIASLDAQIRGHIHWIRERLERIRTEWIPQQRQQIEEAIQRTRMEMERQIQAEVEKFAQAYQAWKNQAAAYRQWAEDCWEGMRFVDPRWNSWTPASQAPTRLRLGTLRMRFTVDQIGLRGEMEPVPAMVPFRGARGLLIKTPPARREEALIGIQAFLFRLLATIPPGKLRFLFLDPVGLGNNVAALMNLREFDESEEDSLVSSRAWVEPDHIRKQLERIKDHISTVIQERLRDKYQNIEQYNEEAGEIAEPYRIVVALDFPIHFDDIAARHLLSIAETGPRCGVYPIVLMDTTAKLPYDFKPEKLEQALSVIEWSEPEGRWIWRDAPWPALEFERPPQSALAERIIQEWGKASIEARKVEVPFARMLTMPGVELSPERWWKDSTARQLAIPLGPVSPRKAQSLILGKGTMNHALVVGRTGSGKSNLMHVIITGAALKYPPEELRLYLIDLKTVEFTIYRDLPHAEAVAVDSDREFALSVLSGLDREMQSRMEKFRAVEANDLEEYRQKSGQPLPRVLLLIDEFQVLFEWDDEIAAEARRLLDRLVRQGRAFGIHILLGSQSLAGAPLPRSTLDQMAVRIALQCSEADSRLILAEDNPAARRLSRPGQAIYNSANGLVEGNQEFQVALFDDAARDEFLARIRALAEDHKIQARPIVFEGNAPARLDACLPLRQRLAGQSPLPRIPETWIGEPVAMGEPITLRFPRASGRHLGVITREEPEGVGILLAAILGLAASYPPDRVRFYIADFTTADAEWAEFPELVAASIPHPAEVMGRRDFLQTLAELHRRVQRFAETSEAPPEDVYLAILGLHRVRDLRMSEDMGFRFGGPEGEQASPPEQLAALLRDGPEAGVHVLLWCDTLANLRRSLDRRAIGEIGLRVAGAMSEQDSVDWIDNAAAARLNKPHRAIFYDDERPGVYIKFRPYGILDIQGRGGQVLWRFPDYARQVGEALRARFAPAG